MKYLPRFFRDIERCPYLPSEPGYDAWMENDNRRLKELEEKRQRILRYAKLLIKHHSNTEVTHEMATFVIEQLDNR